jgi:hypothetical protein
MSEIRRQVQQGSEATAKAADNIHSGLEYRAEHPAGALQAGGAMLFAGGIAVAVVKGQIPEGIAMSAAGAGLFKAAKPIENFLRP